MFDYQIVNGGLMELNGDWMGDQPFYGIFDAHNNGVGPRLKWEKDDL